MTEQQKAILRQCVERNVHRFTSREAAIEMYEEILHAAIGTDALLNELYCQSEIMRQQNTTIIVKLKAIQDSDVQPDHIIAPDENRP